MIFLNLLCIPFCAVASFSFFALRRYVPGWVFLIGALVNTLAVAMKLFTWMPN